MSRSEMTEIDIDLPVSLDADTVVAAVGLAVTNEALQATLRTTLKKYSGSTHWHFKKNKERGVLEVTWWPYSEGNKSSRLWFSAHNNRQAEWMSELIPRLKKAIEAQLSK